jgi:hypothetical protein
MSRGLAWGATHAPSASISWRPSWLRSPCGCGRPRLSTSPASPLALMLVPSQCSLAFNYQEKKTLLSPMQPNLQAYFQRSDPQGKAIQHRQNDSSKMRRQQRERNCLFFQSALPREVPREAPRARDIERWCWWEKRYVWSQPCHPFTHF